MIGVAAATGAASRQKKCRPPHFEEAQRAAVPPRTSEVILHLLISATRKSKQISGVFSGGLDRSKNRQIKLCSGVVSAECGVASSAGSVRAGSNIHRRSTRAVCPE